MNPLAKYSDLRLCRVLNGLDNRVGPRTYRLREMILKEMGSRVATADVSERKRMISRLRARA